MKRIRLVLAGLLTALLCGCFPPPPEPAPGPGPEPAPAEQVQAWPDFEDVPEGAWYAGAANWCRENGLMGGTAQAVFSPGAPLTRSMLAMVLYQEAGSPDAAGPTPYTDVPEDAWYAPPVMWCTGNGAVAGYGSGRFGPEDPITREQLISVLWRYSGSPETGAGTNFTDEADIAGYAQTAVDWSRTNGIVAGTGGNRFAPKAQVTRAQAAAIFQRYFQWRRGMPPVFLTRNVSPQGLSAVYRALNWTPSGRLAVKLSTGELSSNCLRPELTGGLIRLLDAPVVECCSADGGPRSHPESHKRLAEELGYTDLDILDKDGAAALPVSGGSWLTETYVGSGLAGYGSLVILSHFSGHEMAGFSGAVQNLSLGLASGEGKSHIRSGGGQ